MSAIVRNPTLAAMSLLTVFGCASQPTAGDSNSICLTMPYSDDEKNEKLSKQLDAAIVKNDGPAAKALLAGQSFKCSAMTSMKLRMAGTNEQSYARDPVYRLMGKAIEAGKNGQCRNDIISAMANADAAFGPGGVTALAKYGCTPAIESIFTKMSEEERLASINQFSDELSSARPITNSVDFLRLNPSLKYFSDHVNAECEKSGAASEACAVKPKIAANIASINARSKQLTDLGAYQQSPAYQIVLACNAASNMKASQAAIDHEKEIGKVSGAVNLEALHSHGQNLVMYKKDLTDASAKYKEQTGKDLNLKNDCNSQK